MDDLGLFEPWPRSSLFAYYPAAESSAEFPFFPADVTKQRRSTAVIRCCTWMETLGRWDAGMLAVQPY